MARFVFSMQNLLNIKEKLETQEKNNFSQANLRLMEAQEKLAQLQYRLEATEESLRETVRSLADLQEVRRLENAVEVIKMYRQQQKLVVLQREKEVEVARQRLNDAMRERKTFEKLREKAFKAFMEEESRAEQKEVDELVSYRYGTRTMADNA
jgi:flagellar FliJ protein